MNSCRLVELPRTRLWAGMLLVTFTLRSYLQRRAARPLTRHFRIWGRCSANCLPKKTRCHNSSLLRQTTGLE